MAVGDSIRSLEGQLAQAQSRMERLERQMQNKTEQMKREQEREIAKLHRDMEHAVKEKGQQLEQEYNAILRTMECRMKGELSANVQKMQNEYEELQIELKKAEQDLQEQSKAMQEYVNQVKEDAAAKEEITKKEAENSLKNMEHILAETEKLPCERFCQGRLEIVKDVLRETKGFFRKGFYQLVLGNASFGTADTRRLNLEVSEHMEEWKACYHEWKELYASLQEMLKVEETYAGTILDFPDDIAPEVLQDHDWKADICYWSRGKMIDWERKLEEHGRQIQKIEDTGEDAYLQQGEGMTVDELKKRRQDLEELYKEFTELASYYKNEFNAYWDRISLGDEIAKRLIEYDYQLFSNGFEPALGADQEEERKEYLRAYESEADSTDEDYRETYYLDFRTDSGNLLTVMISSQKEENGPEVFNRVRYSFEILGPIGGVKYKESLKEILSHAFAEATNTEKGGVSLTCRAQAEVEGILDLTQESLKEEIKRKNKRKNKVYA